MDRPIPPPRQNSQLDFKNLINNVFKIEKKLSRIDEEHNRLDEELSRIDEEHNRLDEDHTTNHIIGGNVQQIKDTFEAIGDSVKAIGGNVQRIKDAFEEAGLTYEDPTGEPYDETRTDCDANIAGDSQENLVITEVIKPIIRVNRSGVSRIEQQGRVIVKSQNQQTTDE